MPREPKHSSGAAKVVTVRLSPAHIRRLDELRASLDLSRSDLVARLLETGFSAKPAVSPNHPSTGAAEPPHPQPLAHVLGTEAANERSTACEHLPIRRRTIAGGMVRCDACGMVRGAGGIWR